MTRIPAFGMLLAIGTLFAAGCGGQSKSNTTAATATRSAQKAAVPLAAQHKIVKRGAVKSADAPGKDDEGPERAFPKHPAKATSFRLTFSGKAIVSHATSASSMVAIVTLRPGAKQICWQFVRSAKGVVHSAALGRVRTVVAPTSAAIHAGASGRSGPEVVGLATSYRRRGCTATAPTVLNSIAAAPRFYYVNVVTGTFPGHSVRAQL